MAKVLRSGGAAASTGRREPVVLITGAGRGIGRATAEAFAAKGNVVVLAGRFAWLWVGAPNGRF